MEIIKHFDQLRPHLTMFTGDELSRMESLSRGFNFCGLNLLIRRKAATFDLYVVDSPHCAFDIPAFAGDYDEDAARHEPAARLHEVDALSDATFDGLDRLHSTGCCRFLLDHSDGGELCAVLASAQIL